MSNNGYFQDKSNHGLSESKADLSALRLSVPAPGRTIFSATAPLINIFHQAVNLLEHNLSADAKTGYDIWFSPRDERLALGKLEHNHIAWVIIAMWSTYRVINSTTISPTIEEAENWFFDDDPGDYKLCSFVGNDVRLKVNRILSEIDSTLLSDLMPYALDHHGFGSRRDVLRDYTNIASRISKRRSGVYYTPSDVTDYMVRWALNNNSGNTILDPACGTGVFLLGAAKYMISNGVPTENVIDNLYGIDIDPLTIDLACFVLTACIGRIEHILSPFQIWHLIRLNMGSFDTISLLLSNKDLFSDLGIDSIMIKRLSLRCDLKSNKRLIEVREFADNRWFSLKYLFPETGGYFDAIVSNPPYAQIGYRKDMLLISKKLISLQNASLTPSVNTFIPFMESMWLFVKENGRSAMIVPMSVAYNSSSSHRSIRRAFTTVGGHWYFRFFDRTPDAIFGDDIKQRTSIVLHERKDLTGFVLQTSSIHRWTSRSRHRLFSSLPEFVQLPECNIASGIPKLSQIWERDIYTSLIARKGNISSVVNSSSDHDPESDSFVYIGSTAYNYLVLYRKLPEEHNPTSNTSFRMISSQAADWIYAILVSRLTYWLWRVDGDGFHVPLSFITNLPFMWDSSNETCQEIASLGRYIWIKAQKIPVDSINSGRRTRSYNTLDILEINTVDRLLLQSFLLNIDLSLQLHNFVTDTVIAGRNAERKQRHDAS